MNSYSSDPIQPGVNTPYGNQNSGSSTAKIVLIVVLLVFFVLPVIFIICIFVFASSIVKTIANDGINISGSDILSSDTVAMQSLEAFQLAARYPRYRDAGLVTHADCEAVSNAIIRLDSSRITGPARWFGNGFCENKEIEVYSEEYHYNTDYFYKENADGSAHIEMKGINIDFDSVMASMLSFSDGTRCATFTLSAQGILDYQIETIEASNFCKEGGATIKLGDDKSYEAPAEETPSIEDEEEPQLKTKAGKVPQLSI